MQKKKWIPLLLSLLAWINPLQAAIEEVSITWNAFKCQDTCVAQINQQFSTIQGVSNLKINPGAGVATMQWNPSQPFSYEPFRYAAAAVGIRISTMRVRVSGTITHDAQNVYLVSSGDGTRFHLAGPIQTQPGRYTPKYNPITHPLSADIREQLLQTELKQLPVVISGPLLLPSHYHLLLVAEQIKIPPAAMQPRRP